MKFLIFLVIFLLSLIQTSFVRINFLLILVLFFAFLGGEVQALSVAFFAGLIFDLLKGGVLGLSSVGFLLVSLVILLYRQRFLPSHPFFLFLATFLSSFVFALIARIPWSFFEGLVLAVIVLLVKFFFPNVFETLKSGQLKLKV